MKKLLVILFLAGAYAYGQSSTISDRGSFFELNYDQGPGLSIEKAGLMLDTSGTSVYISTLLLWGDRGVPRRMATVDYADFGFGTLDSAYSYLQAICFNSLTTRFNQVTNPDSIFFLYGTDTVSYQLLTYSSDSLLVIGPITSW